MTAIQYINEYYIKVSLKHFEKEEEFVFRCMENLNEASASLNHNQDSALLVIQRGLLLLKVGSIKISTYMLTFSTRKRKIVPTLW